MITNPDAIRISDAYLRPIANLMSQLYDQSVMLLNAYNALGGSGISNAVAAPTVAASTGGSFAAGTYSWKYTFLNALGETLASANVTLAVTLNQKVTVTLPALEAGATSINVYRGPVGTEGLVGNTATTSFVDTGAAAGAQAPSSNTTGLFPNDTEILNDGAVTGPDGRPVVTGIKAVAIVSRCTDIKNLMEGSVAIATNDGSKSILNTVLAYCTNP